MFVKCIAFMSAKGSLLAGSVLEIVPGSLAGQLEAALPARVPLGLGVLLPLLLLTESLPLLPLQEVQPGQLSTGGRDTGFILGSNIICCRKSIKVLKIFLMWNTIFFHSWVKGTGILTITRPRSTSGRRPSGCRASPARPRPARAAPGRAPAGDCIYNNYTIYFSRYI